MCIRDSTYVICRYIFDTLYSYWLWIARCWFCHIVYCDRLFYCDRVSCTVCHTICTCDNCTAISVIITVKTSLTVTYKFYCYFIRISTVISFISYYTDIWIWYILEALYCYWFRIARCWISNVIYCDRLLYRDRVSCTVCDAICSCYNCSAISVVVTYKGCLTIAYELYC